jgi:hypothetical protein
MTTKMTDIAPRISSKRARLSKNRSLEGEEINNGIVVKREHHDAKKADECRQELSAISVFGPTVDPDAEKACES